MGISSGVGDVGQVPVGVVNAFAGTTAPSGWLLCAGQAVDRVQYAGLFLTIGTTYGVGDGSTTFNVPDLRGRVVAGIDNMGGTDAGRLSVANTLGVATGAETVTLSSDNLPTHTHAIDHDHPSFNATSGIESANHSHTYTYYYVYLYTNNVGYANPGYYSGYYPASGTGTTSTVSANHTHTTSIDVPAFAGNSGNGGFANTAVDKMQPTIILNYIIKAA